MFVPKFLPPSRTEWAPRPAAEPQPVAAAAAGRHDVANRRVAAAAAAVTAAVSDNEEKEHLASTADSDRGRRLPTRRFVLTLVIPLRANDKYNIYALSHALPARLYDSTGLTDDDSINGMSCVLSSFVSCVRWRVLWTTDRRLTLPGYFTFFAHHSQPVICKFSAAHFREEPAPP